MKQYQKIAIGLLVGSFISSLIASAIPDAWSLEINSWFSVMSVVLAFAILPTVIFGFIHDKNL